MTEDIAEYRQSLRKLNLEQLIGEWRKVKKELKVAHSSYGGAEDTSPAEDEKWQDFLLAAEYHEAHGGDIVAAANDVFGNWEEHEEFEEYYCGSDLANHYFREQAYRLEEQLDALNEEGTERLGKKEWRKQRRSKKYKSKKKRITSDDLDVLERIAALRGAEIITDAEFDSAKRYIPGIDHPVTE